MALGIYAFGHGGGIPGPFVHQGVSVGNAGNTNFALIPDMVSNVTINEFGQLISHMPFNVMKDILATRKFWLMDCGPETMLAVCGVTTGVPVTQNLQGIFLTHAHDDHVGGIKSLAYRCKFIDRIRPSLFVPSLSMYYILKRQTAEFAYAKKGKDSYGLCEDYMIETMDSDLHVPWNIPGFTANPFVVNHNRFDSEGNAFPAFGYTVTTDAGKVVVFSGDTAYPIVPTRFKEADLIFHDVQFYDDGTSGDQSHCPYAWLRDAVRPEDRHKVYLTHCGHKLPPEAIADGFHLFHGGDTIVIE
jgi:ribonuclease BN (tRNA processing enzyme)